MSLAGHVLGAVLVALGAAGALAPTWLDSTDGRRARWYRIGGLGAALAGVWVAVTV